MEILACIKRVPITGSQLMLTPDNMSLQTDNMGYGISPHEENAVEAGVQLTEQMGGALTLLTLGPTDAEEQLRASLAVGAARAILLETDGNDWDPQATANALISVFVGASSAFAFSRMRFKGRKIGLQALLLVQVFSSPNLATLCTPAFLC